MCRAAQIETIKLQVDGSGIDSWSRHLNISRPNRIHIREDGLRSGFGVWPEVTHDFTTQLSLLLDHLTALCCTFTLESQPTEQSSQDYVKGLACLGNMLCLAKSQFAILPSLGLQRGLGYLARVSSCQHDEESERRISRWLKHPKGVLLNILGVNVHSSHC